MRQQPTSLFFHVRNRTQFFKPVSSHKIQLVYYIFWWNCSQRGDTHVNNHPVAYVVCDFQIFPLHLSGIPEMSPRSLVRHAKKSPRFIPPTKILQGSWGSPHQQVLHPHAGPPRHVGTTVTKQDRGKWQWRNSLEGLIGEVLALTYETQNFKICKILVSSWYFRYIRLHHTVPNNRKKKKTMTWKLRRRKQEGPNARFCTGIWLEWLRKTTTYVSEDSRSKNRHL